MACISIIGTGNMGQAIDAGALSRARELEAIGFLQSKLAATEKVAWSGGFGVVAKFVERGLAVASSSLTGGFRSSRAR